VLAYVGANDGFAAGEAIDFGHEVLRLDLVIEPGLDRYRGGVEPNARLLDLKVAAVESRR
jgi:hypothetical protein